ncbi:MAG: DUF6348 family protein [Sandaracinus sp.]
MPEAADTSAWAERVARALVTELEELTGVTWERDGVRMRSPLGAVRTAELHADAGRGHVDIGIALNGVPGLGALWDCAAGPSACDDAAAKSVAHLWASTTAPAILELGYRDGRFADHADHDPTLGLAEWHSVHGPLIAFGPASAHADAIALRDWALAHPLVPQIRASLSPALASPGPHGVKLFLADCAGGAPPIAEVRIDGIRDDASSEALLGTPWPRRATGSCLRSFVVFLHR